MIPKCELLGLKLGRSFDQLVEVSEVLDVAISGTDHEIETGDFHIHLRDNDLEYRMEYLEDITGDRHRDSRGRLFGFPGFEQDWGEIYLEATLRCGEDSQKISGLPSYAWGSTHPVRRMSAAQKMYSIKVLSYGNPSIPKGITPTDKKSNNSFLRLASSINDNQLCELAEEYVTLLRLFGAMHHNMIRLQTREYFSTMDINRDFNNFIYERYGHSVISPWDLKPGLAIDCRKFLFDEGKSDYSLKNLLDLGKKWSERISNDRVVTNTLCKYLDSSPEQYIQEVGTVINELQKTLETIRKDSAIVELKKYVNKTQVHVDRKIYTTPIIQCSEPTADILESTTNEIGALIHQFGQYILQCDMSPEIMGTRPVFSRSLSIWALHDIALAYSNKQATKIDTYAELQT